MADRNPYTHTQYKDRPGSDLCRNGHHFVPFTDDGDWPEHEDVPFVCTYCGMSDIEPEDGA